LLIVWDGAAMKTNVLALAALAEAATGVILLAYPPIVVRLLFAKQVFGAGMTMSRLAGICLISLGLACWPAADSRRGFQGMLAWSVLAALYLIVVGVGDTAGILLWPMVAVHALLTVLLVRALGRTHSSPTS
jgi:hypothetical protein